MKEIKNVAAAENFSAISVGKLNELSDYVIELSPEVKIPGKVFGGACSEEPRSRQRAASSPSRCSSRARKQDSSTPTRIMRNFISSLREKVSFRWTDRCSPLKKEAWCAYRPTGSAAYATTGQLRSSCSVYSIGAIRLRRKTLPTA